MSYIDLPNHSRIWIYQCDRELNTKEISVVKTDLAPFIKDWNTHGESMTSAADVFYNRFIIFFVDEKVTSASGCSIDKSVALIKSFETKFNVDFFNRTNVIYKENDEIKQKKMNDFWALRKANVITDNTLVFNNLIKTKKDFGSTWLVPFKESWHAEMW